MDIFQWATNPWGEEVLVRISWNLLYLSAVAGVLFLVAHALYVRFWVPRYLSSPSPVRPDLRIPERVPRHSLAARLFHWVMAAAMLVLLLTGFLPVVGAKFDWVTWHWIAGVVLIGSILFHIVHAAFWQDLWAVWIGPADIREARLRIQRAMGRRDLPAPRKHGKYPLENKLYHHIIVLTGGATILTGVLMMYRVETPFFTRDPYLFSDASWGLVYVTHGLAAVSLVALVMAHVYFAVRPEKLWITKSMIVGWIERRHYLEHHDPERWVVAAPPVARAPEAPAAETGKIRA